MSQVGRPVPRTRPTKVEAPVQVAVLVSSGLAAVTAGAFIRDCTAQAQMLAGSWCGEAPPAAEAHAHCLGCALVAAGLVALTLALGAAVRRRFVTARTGARP